MGEGSSGALPDGALWREAMRGVVPLSGRPAASPPARPPVAEAPPSPPRHKPLPPLAAGFAGVDRATSERLKRGLYPVEAQLDLH
ncbi:MAG TPA: hypothetical protein VE993_08110, partial [Stellaceae bacterium]|nr:hypothetical protein [Stellaceae bacterium]